jgi:hypothetical protein
MNLRSVELQAVAIQHREMGDNDGPQLPAPSTAVGAAPLRSFAARRRAVFQLAQHPPASSAINVVLRQAAALSGAATSPSGERLVMSFRRGPQWRRARRSQSPRKLSLLKGQPSLSCVGQRNCVRAVLRGEPRRGQ